ncbi:hypothetical protein BC936DRAFT_140028 [Jimgerdemannia flammicorona]|uniref:Ricin B lectin domain-containing protein n=1 Tax=Jimgerdemannia flammicorona TaxID=994334 RepID=A0A433B5X1_9FUNG|nr:hypothetical protein BC936DRAFT_140028 [Jimgerdemannia flammicorona]
MNMGTNRTSDKHVCTLDLCRRDLVNGTQIIQWQQKSATEAANQQWLLTVDSYIFKRSYPDVLTAPSEIAADIDDAKVRLLQKKAGEHSEQHWLLSHLWQAQG